MDGIEILTLVFFTAVAIGLLIIISFCLWWFSGYLCTTFNWYDLDQNAQIVTWVVLATIGCSGVKR